MIKKEDLFQFPKAKWVLPFFACHSDFCFRYIDLLSHSIGGGYDFIKCVYGSPACKMNGGLLARNIDESTYLNEIDEWNSRGIPVWVTFSNYLITLKEAIEDKQSNKILNKLNINKELYGINNGVILSADTLYKYIKHTYPNLNLIASVIRQTLLDHPYNKEDYKSLESKYDCICLSHHHNNHVDEIINDLNDNPDKYEFLLNDDCLHGCHFVKKCYEWQCLKSLGKTEFLDDPEIFKYCPIIHDIESEIIRPQECYTVLTVEELNKLSNAGFYNFKLAGRHLALPALQIVSLGWMITADRRDWIMRMLYEKHNPKDRNQIDTNNLYFKNIKI